MWRAVCFLFFTVTLGLGGSGAPAAAASRQYLNAEREFQGFFTLEQRIKTQILLIAAGYANAVPTKQFSSRIFKAVKAFQADNGFVPNGRLTRGQLERLVAFGGEKLSLWGFRKIAHPSRPAVSIWAPAGLGLRTREDRSGLHLRDPQDRLELDFTTRPDASAVDAYKATLAQQIDRGFDIHFEVFKDDWFVISSTSRDGHDHYYRYHQDGTSVTGFALEWNAAAGDVKAERVAVIVSGSLWASMTGAPFIDPPSPPEPPQIAKLPEPQPTTVTPVAPTPPPSPPGEGVHSGTGFFVSDAGHFVTNAHVIKNCTKILVKTDDGAVVTAAPVGTDETNDLAILKLGVHPRRVVALRIGARLGEGVEAFGFPHSEILSTSGNFTLGNVTALSGMHDDSRYLQISAPVQSGNSGGPLLDGNANLVGVVSAKLNAIKVALENGDLPQNVNFAVKSAMLAAFLDASRVAYKVATPGAKKLDPADIAEQARAMSGFVVCR